ncbi:MAG: hypothetical protein K6F73_07810 [Lachnospiraceae bacterium]|nr:hypothetical protein [Lachnospiraceae bacterium]
MSERDKKLLVYLGALIILAAAYFLCARPFLDKIDKLTSEKTELDMELSRKSEAYAKQDEYKAGIESANSEIDDIIDRFPEDNTDEKSIMFASHAEADIPIWFSQMQFAEETQALVNGGEVESASDVEQQQLEENVAAAEGDEAPGDIVPDAAAQNSTSAIGGLIGRDTELGLTFQVEYEEFKKFLAYIRDYDDRIVIKDIDVSYASYSDLVSGTVTLSQYAILGEGRTLPEVVTDVDSLGTDNVFKHSDQGGSILDILADMASDFLNKLMGGLSGDDLDRYGEDYFIKANAVTDNTNGITAGKADDPEGESYITSDTNDTQKIVFTLSGESGDYIVRYSVGDNEYEDKITRGEDDKVYLHIISTERSGDGDKVSMDIHAHNSSDIPLVINVDGDDSEKPRFKISEKDGEITVND